VTDRKKAEGFLRTEAERQAAAAYARIFRESGDPVETKLQQFVKYVRRQDLTRLLARYELFKQVLGVKGSIVECGVYRGFGLMAWAQFSAILEPNNLMRRVYGFDTFAGFPRIGERDRNRYRTPEAGELEADTYTELVDLIRAFDDNRFLGHVSKVGLIKGDAQVTIPEFIRDNPHLVVSLLFLDFDLYEPTKAAIEHLLPRIPKGGIIAFDELDNPIWPGETLALLDTAGLGALRLRRTDFDPYIGYAVIE